MIGGQALGLSKQQVHDQFDEIVDFFDMGHFIDLLMEAFSSEMTARLRFATSTSSGPDILAEDETPGVGDADFRDRALWMEQGHLVMDGPSGEVVDAYSAWVAQRRRTHRRRRTGQRTQEGTA